MISAPASPTLNSVDTDVFVSPPAVKRFRVSDEVCNLSFVPLFTLILWLGCLVIGGIGLVLHYRYPQLASPPAPMVAELLNVELTQEPLAPQQPEPSAASSTPPPLSTPPVIPPQAPPMAAIAEPSPAIAFALPVQAPATVSEVRQATYAVIEPKVLSTTAPQVQTLTHGYGEGKQPAPIYPARALREGQEGTVRVRFNVGENGRVISAEASTPSPWSLLNHEAVRVVRERWRFRAGAARLYEVAIRFELQK